MAGNHRKIAIMGAGLTGAYLYRLLDRNRYKVDIFDLMPRTRCGIKPCAWGTSTGFEEQVKNAGLSPEKYLRVRSDRVVMDGIKIPADLTTFDKPKLIEDLLQGARIEQRRPDVTAYERIIDATGVSRAFLPPVVDDIILDCIQYRIRTDAVLENRIELGGIGFAWAFPLSGNEYHIGCGSLLSDPLERLKQLGWIGGEGPRSSTLCGCQGRIRLTGPHYSLPFVTTDGPAAVWGVGEAIGCVAPLAGDGIVPGMKSVDLLIEQWDDPDRYSHAIQREFAWMKSERKVIDKLRRKRPLGLNDARILRRNSRRMGMEVRLRDAGLLLKHLS